jgi:alkanesulfonate monooxygenase SsuD/methylene tetrahydromethanopterin reductase-like flavin-dependent oxidoreductase (luciferase family)
VKVNAGVVLPTRLGPTAPSYDSLLAMAEFVDSLESWHDLWVTDSIISLPFYDSVTLLSACAARTQRVRLGVACEASLGLRHPLIVAQQWANLDVLSKGRVTMIACPGEATGPTRVKELAAFNMTHREKVARMEESVNFLRLVSRGGRVDFAGTYFSLDDFEIAPAFSQRPLPIWMTGNPPQGTADGKVTRVLDRVARLGDGWLTFAVTPDTLSQRAAQLRELRASLGHTGDDFPICVFLNVNVDLDAKKAREDALNTWQRQSTRNVSPDDLLAIAAIGSPDQAADFVGELRDAGATAVAFDLLSNNPREQVEKISEHLLPLL